MSAKTRSQAAARRALDVRLSAIAPVMGRRPSAGWVRAIRDALGMSGADLGARMGITQSRVSQLERAEESGSIRISTLERAADALECDLVYALVPRSGSLDASVRNRALAKASAQAAAAAHTMRLEDQSADAELAPLINELADQLLGSPGLWR